MVFDQQQNSQELLENLIPPIGILSSQWDGRLPVESIGPGVRQGLGEGLGLTALSRYFTLLPPPFFFFPPNFTLLTLFFLPPSVSSFTVSSPSLPLFFPPVLLPYGFKMVANVCFTTLWVHAVSIPPVTLSYIDFTAFSFLFVRVNAKP